ncbi:alpha-galactosidase [Dysgonomonas sp. Marseille-P4677]|uniref:alpha-galactosidase n=1 Tax=Dysgonomonas sp. Marseille-P4677 TaxID=2364790 RepID=UPI001914B542|nr:alpha-galactosidase [Dysgonomonas sp. Marseille-P4677]MBK5721057.1 alpha-galactosidase [Dysgonomonas sp. Marseille-P4677]
MKTNVFLLIFLIVFFICSCGQNSSVKNEKWTIIYNPKENNVGIKKDSCTIFNGVYASYKIGNRLITTKEYARSSSKTYSIDTKFGKGKILEITYIADSLPTLIQAFEIYPDKDYILTEFRLKSDKEISSNYMAPVNIDQAGKVLPDGNNRALFVPFDNDAWVRFKSHPLTFENLRSYEVTAIFNNETRKGLVIGSIEHDCWKTAVDITKGQDVNNVGSIICYGGVADSLTRDTNVHGSVQGKEIKSPLVMLGYSDDWRTGMDEYGKANAIVSPRPEWKGAVPFGWNSWGALQFNLRYNHAMEVSDYFKTNLQNNNFVTADNTVYIGLDSGWNIFSETELKSFVDKCKVNGQKAGIYWTPFTDWGKNPEREVENAQGYKFKDIYVYAQGKPQEFDGAYAIDPTHPAIEQRMKATSELFKRCGFEYVKMDFMGHGAMEGDKWYNTDIKTGMQAYNYGMKLLVKYFGDMFINLSISPIFPAQYAQSRRIACDAWNKIKDTEYTMNAVSYGWWIDNAYQFNDADHVVLRDATEGENRARVTSAIITGLIIIGDDFSLTGPKDSKERAGKYLTNAAVNSAAFGKSYRPVEGTGENSENQFVYTDKDGNTFLALFNYDETEKFVSIPFDRLNLKTSEISRITELWSGKSIETGEIIPIPAKDAKLLKIEQK